MYHSITIGDKNTWGDWHLIPASRPLVNPPSVKTHFIDIPGGNGSIDLTESLGGKPTYKNRTGSWKFYVDNGYKEWSELYSEIMGYLHGQRKKAVLEDDPAYFYEGRFFVDSWNSDPYYSVITIGYNVNPYKWCLLGSTEEWIWDTFNFETGVIKSYRNMVLNGNLNVELTGGIIEAVPTITTTENGVMLTYGGKTYALSKGHNIIDEIVIRSGEHTLLFQGSGEVTVECRGGLL